MTEPETVSELLQRIRLVKDWAQKEQAAAVRRIADTNVGAAGSPPAEARGMAEVLVTHPLAMLEQAMKILLGEDGVDDALRRTAMPD